MNIFLYFCLIFVCRQTIEQKNSSSSIQADNSKDSAANDKKKPHIKKPLNAFMLYMKEMRAKVVAECTLKESAAINQILGRKVCLWNATLFFFFFCINYTKKIPYYQTPPSNFT